MMSEVSETGIGWRRFLPLGVAVMLLAGCGEGGADLSASPDRPDEVSETEQQRDSANEEDAEGPPDDSSETAAGAEEIDVDVSHLPLMLSHLPTSYEEGPSEKEVVSVDEATGEPRAIRYSTRHRVPGEGADEKLIIFSVTLHDGSVDTSPEAVESAMNQADRGQPERVWVRGQDAVLVPPGKAQSQGSQGSLSWEERPGMAVRITGRNIAQDELIELADKVAER